MNDLWQVLVGKLWALKILFWCFFQNKDIKLWKKMFKWCPALHITLVSVPQIRTVTSVSALMSALSFSKCHLVSCIFYSLKKSNLRCKKVLNITNLKLATSLFYNCCCLYFSVIFFFSPFCLFWFSPCSMHYEVILRSLRQLQSILKRFMENSK